MKWSLSLGSVAGIRIYVHWTFVILIGWILISHIKQGHGLADGLVGVAFVLTIFLCVILHELGHALTARRFNIKTKNITILPIGGLASMERMPEKPGQELWVAIMGPVVNVVIALILYLYLAAVDGIPGIEEIQAIEESKGTLLTEGFFLFNLLLVNVILVVFNLIPAFPMDGGRVLRALLSYGTDRVRATKIAARIGQFLAIIFVFAGFYTNFWLVFIGIFIFLGAGGEASFETTKSILANYRVKDVLMTKYTVLSPDDTLGDAVGRLLDGQEQEFLVGTEHEVQGILGRTDLIKGLHELGKDALVTKAMKTEFVKLNPESELRQVYQEMVSKGYTIVPVFDNDRLIGALDRENVDELILVKQALGDHA